MAIPHQEGTDGSNFNDLLRRHTVIPPEIVIVIDSREQRPLTFSLPTERGTLTTGDYSMKGYEQLVAVERKEVNDLIGCLKNGERDRFERELSRGRELDYFALVIECDLSDIANHKYQSRMMPRAAIQSLLTFSIRYRLPIFFCPDRRYAARVIESLLQKYVREVKKLNDEVAVSI